jgi:hypothetical protein
MKAFVMSSIRFPENEVLVISPAHEDAVRRYEDVIGCTPNYVRCESYTAVLLDYGQKVAKDGRSQD